MEEFDSRKIAKKIGIQHSDILKKIAKLHKISSDINNIKIEKIEKSDRKKYYILNKKAFIFLINRFRGKNSLIFQDKIYEKYFRNESHQEVEDESKKLTYEEEVEKWKNLIVEKLQKNLRKN